MGNILRAILGAGMMCLYIGSAHATLIGDNATLTFSESPGTTPFAGTPATNTLADAPIDFAVDDPSVINGSPIFNWTVDFQGSQGTTLVINGLQQETSLAGFARAFDLSLLDLAGTITNATLVSTNFTGGGGGGSVDFTSNSVTFDTGNFGATAGVGGNLTAVINIKTVPEPGTLLLLLIGGVAAGIATRQSRRPLAA
jgi:hypothetical protein